MKLEDFLTKEYGYNTDCRKAMESYFRKWRSWYEGNVKWSHSVEKPAESGI